MSQKVLIEQDQFFSKSILWKSMRHYYATQGVNAWTGAVPYYVTSHPVMANIYAQMIVQTLLDWQAEHPEQCNEPFIVVELAAGCGKLSHLLLHELNNCMKRYQLDSHCLRYIMTDFAEENIRFWQQQPQLQSHVQSGMLDFAQLDLENFSELHCMNQGPRINSKERTKTPMIVLGNYILDTLPADIMKLENGRIYESIVSVSVNDGKDNINDLLNDSGITLKHKNIELTLPRYSQKIDQALQQHIQKGDDGYFFFPNVALKAIEQLESFSDAGIVLLASDKGYSQRHELAGLEFPKLTFHGSFSIMVNFVSIADWFTQFEKNTIFRQERRAGISTFYACNIFNSGECNRVTNSANEHILKMSNGDFYMIYRGFIETLDGQSANAMIAFLAFAQWDEYIFNKIHHALKNKIKSAHPSSKKFLQQQLPEIMQHHYNMPNSTDTYFNLGLMAMALKDYIQANTFFSKSTEHYGEQSSVYFNMGLCAYFIGDKQQAQDHFKRSHELNPDDNDASAWVTRLEKSN